MVTIVGCSVCCDLLTVLGNFHTAAGTVRTSPEICVGPVPTPMVLFLKLAQIHVVRNNKLLVLEI